MGNFYNDSNKTPAENQILNAFQAFQILQSELSLEQIKEVRRHLIAIEKALFLNKKEIL
jgi:hypothetical protein